MKLPQRVIEGTLPRIVFAAGLADSVGDADRIIKNGGIYIGGSPGQKSHENVGMRLDQLQFTPARTWKIADNAHFLIDAKILLLRKGKHNIRCIEFISDQEWDSRGLEYPGQANTGRFRKALAKLKEMKERKNGETFAGPGDISQIPGIVMPTSRKQLEMSDQNLSRSVREWQQMERSDEAAGNKKPNNKFGRSSRDSADDDSEW